MQLKDNYNILSFLLIFLSFTSYFLGFYLDENSSGGGGYFGDWQFAWPNIQIFLNEDIFTALNNENYASNRPPLLYILHKFNPFIETEIGYRRSVFVISLAIPILFYLCLKQKFKKVDNLLLLLIASTIFLSPYYRTSAYWGLEENYSFISLLLSFLFLNHFLENKSENGYKIYLQLFFSIFFSSLCIYFDQKLLIIPIICFLTIITSKKLNKLKILSTFFYLVLSLPFIYLIILWGAVAPGPVSLTNQLYLDHIGYTSTMIAFYLVPLFFFKEKKLFSLIKNSLLKKFNYFLILFFFIYLTYLFFFFDFSELSSSINYPSTGKGLVNKLSFIFFDNYLIKKIFIYFSFFVSWIVIVVFINKNFKDSLILLYFFVLLLFMKPIFQEYFDPLIILMVFTFFSSKLFISYKNTFILFLYSSIFLICCNIYYYNLLN